RWDMDKTWTVEQYMAAFKETSEMMQTVNHRVDVLGDMRETITVPRKIMAYLTENHRKVVVREEGSNYGVSVLVSSSNIVKVMAEVASALPFTQKRFHFVETLEEGYDILERLRQETT
ncbi:MAG: hypothetical protein AAFN11_20550, partial [Chloroflexota bacterium]